MIKYYCDKCGKELNIPEMGYWTVQYNTQLTQQNKKMIYLCSDCEKEFKKFIDNGSECNF